MWLLYVLCAGALSSLSNADSTGTILTLDTGLIRGTETRHAESGNDVKQFLGIPFAEPPLHSLRFAPPRAKTPWSDLIETSIQPRACMQYRESRDSNDTSLQALERYMGLLSLDESEDCLYLNVFTLSTGSEAKSVLFWIYGGSGLSGSISQYLYDGTTLAARHDIVVVAANYRVNVFGNPRLPTAPLRERNVGLLDQRLALDWVQRNIHHFGGDPAKVTIMGESAGAVAIGHHINTYGDDAPFRAAVLLSGSALFKPPPNVRNDDHIEFDALANLSGCSQPSNESSTLECLRALPASTIQRTIESNRLVFDDYVWDNYTTLEYPEPVWKAGDVARVPILIGSTADDGSIFAIGLGNNVTEYITSVFGASDAANALSDFYTSSPDSTEPPDKASNTVAQFLTDFLFRCSAGYVARSTMTMLDVPAWQLEFNALVPSNSKPELSALGLGVFHSSELSLLFGTYPREGSNVVEERLSESMQATFAKFIKDPCEGPGWSRWPITATFSVNDTNVIMNVSSQSDTNSVCKAWNIVYDALFIDPFLVSRAPTPETDPVVSDMPGGQVLESIAPGSVLRLNMLYWIAIWCLLIIRIER